MGLTQGGTPSSPGLPASASKMACCLSKSLCQSSSLSEPSDQGRAPAPPGAGLGAPTGDQLLVELAGFPERVSSTCCPSWPDLIRFTSSEALQPPSRRVAISQRAAHAPAAATPEVCPRATPRGGAGGLDFDLMWPLSVVALKDLRGDLSRTSAL